VNNIIALKSTVNKNNFGKITTCQHKIILLQKALGCGHALLD
jgi:hypothetical protein